jgi:hypothetical protein
MVVNITVPSFKEEVTEEAIEGEAALASASDKEE